VLKLSQNGFHRIVLGQALFAAIMDLLWVSIGRQKGSCLLSSVPDLL
jgi:hypothetical protein